MEGTRLYLSALQILNQGASKKTIKEIPTTRDMNEEEKWFEFIYGSFMQIFFHFQILLGARPFGRPERGCLFSIISFQLQQMRKPGGKEGKMKLQGWQQWKEHGASGGGSNGERVTKKEGGWQGRQGQVKKRDEQEEG